MKWSFPLARVAGIPIRIHLSFLLIVGWIAWLGWTEGGWVSSLWAVALILALFACVVIHELAHSLVAIRFGGKVRSVTLWPIGGVASMKSIPEQPRQELLISLAGPLVNVMIAGLLILARGGFPAWIDVPLVPRGPAELADALARANLILAVFNLLPAFPMDGGRVMRSLLAMFLPYARATSIAAAIGQTLAVGFVLLGLALNPFLMVIGFFVFIGAESEERAARVKEMLQGVYAEDVMLDPFVSLHPEDRVGRCLELASHHRQEDFPVECDGRVVGIMTRKDWLNALHGRGAETPVAEVMKKVFVSVDVRTPLARLYRDLRALEQGLFPVLRAGRMVGVLTAEDISKYLLIQEVRRDMSPASSQSNGNASRFTIDLG